MRPTSAAARLVLALSMVAVACTGGTHHRPQPATTTATAAATTTPAIVIPPSTARTTYACAMNTATEAVTGAYGSASAIGLGLRLPFEYLRNINDQSECIVLERYRDYGALFEHSAEIRNLIGAIVPLPP